jgi:hypothetical protein
LGRLNLRLLQHGPRAGALDRNPGPAAARSSFLSLGRPWQRLESQTSGNTGRPWLRTWVIDYSHPGFADLARSSFLTVNTSTWTMVAVVVALAVVLSRTTEGRYQYGRQRADLQAGGEGGRT